MKRRSSKLWKYLESSGALAVGTDEAIAEAKRAYWKQYHYEHRRAQRKDSPEVIVALSRKDGTYGMLSAAAKKHRMTLAAFIRLAAKSYLTETYIVPDRAAIVHLEGILAQCANALQTLAGQKEKYFWQREEKIETMEARIAHLERELRAFLIEPPKLDQELLKAIEREPELRERFIALLNAHDRQTEITKE